jgi:hypothetical protein
VKIPTVADLLRLGAEQLEALMTLPETIAALNRSLLGLAQTAARLDELVRRMDRITEPLEEPVAAIAPKLAALGAAVDDDMLATIPAILDSMRRNALPALEVIGQTQAQVASIAASMEGLLRVWEQTFGRLQDLPGAGLVNLFRLPDRGSRAPDGGSPPPGGGSRAPDGGSRPNPG